jgi:phage terminase large subunit-like protein
MTNAGDDRSVVLNDLREQALSEIERGVTDTDMAIQEWSAPADADPEDPAALAQANPNLGRRIRLETLLKAARRAKEKGGDTLTGYKTEVMCIRVRRLTPAVDAMAWTACKVPGDLSAVRSRVAMVLDLAPDLRHATLAAAAVLPSGKVRVEVVEAWEGARCVAALRRALPGLVAKVKPRAIGWLPAGPAAALSVDMAKKPGWPPKGVEVSELRAEAAAVCMGFAEQVESGEIVHAGDPLLDAHVTGAEPLKRGEGWVFSRKGDGHVDAAYAAAGAVHLARSLPPSLGKPRLIIVGD